jgi:hypothetical protein
MSTDLTMGVNIFGYINSEFGLGNSCRSFIRKIEEEKIPFSLIEIDSPEEKGNYYECQEENPFPINIIFANPIRNIFKEKGMKKFENKLNIGIWFWELEDVPPIYKEFSMFYDEIWVTSRFCLDSFKKDLENKNIHLIEYTGGGIEKRDKDLCKKLIGIDPQSKLFLFCFDSLSDYHRKNPEGVIKSFKMAFPNQENVNLIIKSKNLTPVQLNKINGLIYNDPRIKLMNYSIDKENMDILMNSCDVYVSLHRSEGFGIPIFDSILLEKAIICTEWSGNLDFCDPRFIDMISYDFIELHPESVYKIFDLPRDTRWADPDLEEASLRMRECYENLEEKIEKVKLNKNKILKRYKSSNLISKRIETLYNNIIE